MRHSLLILVVACGTPKNDPPPAPSATTALVFMSDFDQNYQVNAVDVVTHQNGTALAANAIGSSDVLLRTFGQKLYVVARSYNSIVNNVTVLSLEAGYAPGCSGGGACQFALGYGFNAYDFWAVSERKAYLTSQPDPFTPEGAQYALRNSLTVMNPDSGVVSARIDVDAGIQALGVDLSADDSDGYYGLASLYADNKHLFVSMQMLGGFSIIPRDDACGAVASRVAVIDLDTDKVVKVIKLRGSNVTTRFIPEPGTSNILISTTGSQSVASTDPCNGIERINTKTLELEAPFVTEQSVGGTVMAFALGKNGRGVAFLYTAGDFKLPTYEVRAFNSTGPLGEPISAPGPGGLSQPGFVVSNDRGEAYVGLPFTMQPKMQIIDMGTGAQLDELTMPNRPIDVALVPGTPYSR